jgi:hypothetical protein
VLKHVSARSHCRPAFVGDKRVFSQAFLDVDQLRNHYLQLALGYAIGNVFD